MNSDYNRLISSFISPAWHLLLNAQDHVISISESLMNNVRKKISYPDHHFIYNGINPVIQRNKPAADDLRKIEDLKSKYRLAGNFSVLTHRKGIDMLIKAAAADKGLALLIIGRGKEEESLKKLALKLGVSNRVCFLGFRENINDFYPYLDVYAMTSRSEGFGLSMVEAVAARIPVVCSDIPTFRELFNPVEVTFFETENIQSLTVALQQAVKNSKDFTEKAFDRYWNNYTSPVMARKYLNLYFRFR